VRRQSAVAYGRMRRYAGLVIPVYRDAVIRVNEWIQGLCQHLRRLGRRGWTRGEKKERNRILGEIDSLDKDRDRHQGQLDLARDTRVGIGFDR
jgi:hypothetical protein